MEFVFSHKKSLTRSVLALSFKPAEAFMFLPGQYIEIILPHTKVDSRGTRRYFTICSSPGEEFVTIVTSLPRENERMSSFKKILIHLIPGARVSVFGPLGTFILSDEATS